MTVAHDAVPGPQGPGILRKIALWWGPRPLAQALVIAAVAALLALFAVNTADTMQRIGVTLGFDFLGRSANFEIGESSIVFQAGDTYARAILVGLLNTVKVAALGCVLATMLGIALGIAGLSGNLLLAGLVRGYVEIVRNTPLLLQLFFWIALAKSFPPPRRALVVGDAFFLSNRGVFVPALRLEDGSGMIPLGIVLLAVATLILGWFAWWRGRLSLLFVGAAVAGFIIALVLLFLAAGAHLSLDFPALAGFNIRGGASLTPEFAALLVGLTVKFSAAIAEIVRAGIQSVGRGQWEAARALGLGSGAIMRLVVLPQALRVITPLTTSSFLDLTKDSSLAVAIGYPDLVSIVGTTANTTGQSFEALAILIGVYLALNLSVSALMNRYNRRVALRGMQAR